VKSTPPALDTVDHIHVLVSDRAKARRWYEEVMGLKVVPSLEFWAPEGGPLTIANAAGSIHLALFEKKPTQLCRSTIALRVTAADFLAWREHLHTSLGAECMAIDHQVSWSLYFSDPDGNPFEITTYQYAEVAGALKSAEA
jgi:catechol-2,3-dioxygenase